MWDRQDGVSLAEATGRYERGSAIAANRPCSFVRPQDRGLALVSRYLLSLPSLFAPPLRLSIPPSYHRYYYRRAQIGARPRIFGVSTASPASERERNLARIGRKNKSKKEKSDTIRDRNARAPTKILFTSLDGTYILRARIHAANERFSRATSFLANERRHKRARTGRVCHLGYNNKKQ